MTTELELYLPDDVPDDFKLPNTLPQARWEVITPSVAERYLELNRNNRPVTEGGVRDWAGELLDGAWKPTGQGIAFNDEGSLMDGQHRLMAIIRTGIPMLVLVIRDVPADAFSSMDINRRRTAGQILRMRGVINGTLTAGIVRGVLCYRETMNGRHSSLAGAYSVSRTNREIEEALDFLPGLEDVSVFALRFGKTTALGSPSAVGAALYQCYLADADATQAFIDGVLEGEGLERGDPRLTLRNRQGQTNLREKRGGPSTQEYCMLLVLGAWRAFSQHRPWAKTQVPFAPPLIGPIDLPT